VFDRPLRPAYNHTVSGSIDRSALSRSRRMALIDFG
jgi:hypothetical protein